MKRFKFISYLSLIVLIFVIFVVSCENTNSPIEPANIETLSTEEEFKVTPETISAMLKELEAAGTDAEKKFKELPIEQQQVLIEVLTIAEIVEEDTTKPNPATVKANSCWHRTKIVTGRNRLGWKLWTWTQELYWCGNNKTKKITSFWDKSYGNPNFPAIDWKRVERTVQGGIGSSYVQVQSQAKFYGSIGGLGSITTAYPWIKQIGYWYGNYGAYSNF